MAYLCLIKIIHYFQTGQKHFRKVHINILSYHEGKEDITKAAQMFCRRVKNKETQSKTMNIEHLSQLLQGNNKCNFISMGLTIYIYVKKLF